MMIDTLISLPPSYLVALQFLNLENSNLFFPLSRDSSRQGLINNKGIYPLIAYGLRHIKASIIPFFFIDLLDNMQWAHLIGDLHNTN